MWLDCIKEADTRKYLLFVIALVAVSCGVRQRTASRPAPDNQTKNETVFKTNEDAVKAGIYEEFTDSMVLKGKEPISKPKPEMQRNVQSSESGQESSVIPGNVVMGFRVQLGAFNDQASAEHLADKARMRLPGNIPVYVRYYAPYWKVHAGDCDNRYDAERLTGVIKRNGFPDAWIVSAGINP